MDREVRVPDEPEARMSFRTIFDRSMAVIYITAGVALIATDALATVVPDNRVLLGAVLAGYGALRLYLGWRRTHRTAADGTTSADQR
jgi:hypothetical protein